jgi:hypothetical protein
MITAEKLNEVLASGATVVVATHYRATNYTKKHAGMFFTGKDQNLYVKHGKSQNCLTYNAGKSLLVSIKAYA